MPDQNAITALSASKQIQNREQNAATKKSTNAALFAIQEAEKIRQQEVNKVQERNMFSPAVEYLKNMFLSDDPKVNAITKVANTASALGQNNAQQTQTDDSWNALTEISMDVLSNPYENMSVMSSLLNSQGTASSPSQETPAILEPVKPPDPNPIKNPESKAKISPYNLSATAPRTVMTAGRKMQLPYTEEATPGYHLGRGEQNIANYLGEY